MTDPARSTLARYGGTALAVALATAARLALHPALGHRQPFFMPLLTVIFSAWLGGLGPSLLALGLGAISGAYFLLAAPGPAAPLRVADQLGVALYLVVGAAVIAFEEAGRSARRRLEAEVAERRRAEERLGQSERRFSRFMQHLPGLAWIKDEQGRYVYANDAAERAFRTPRADLYGRSDDEVFPPETAARFRENDRKAREAGAGVQAVETLEDEGGVPRHSLVTKFPMPGPDGEAGLVAGMAIDITDRLRAEEALQGSEERFRALMEQAPFSIQVFAPDGTTLRVNRAWQELWGVTLDQISDYNVLRDPQLEAKGAMEAIRRAFAGEPAAVPAIRYDPNETIPDLTRHEDPLRWVSAVAYPLKDADGRLREVVLVHDDITERKRAEEAIRASEARFRHLADAMPQIVWITRPDRSVEYVNRRWLDYTGQAPEQALAPGGWASAVHPDDLGPILEFSVRSHATGEPFEAEYRIRDASGAFRWHLGRAVPVFDEAGRLARRFGAATDIDDRRRAEQAARFLAEAGASLSSIVDEASTLEKVAHLAVPAFADWCAVDLAGEDGRPRRLAVAHVDPAKAELARDLHRRYPPDPGAPYGAPHVLRTGQSQIIAEVTDAVLAEAARDDEHLRILRDLGLRSYLCVPITGRRGTIGAISFAAAGPGRRYGPDDLRLAEALASRAAVAIENARLYAELTEADRRKDEFLATLAHELRNPLAPIRNALHLMRRPDGDGRMEPERAMAERQVVHLARLIDDLMDVARISRGKIELRKQAVDLATVVGQAVQTARPLIDERRHHLTVSLPDRPITLEADPTRLEQVLWNLLNNAAKYSRPGGRIGLVVEPSGAEVAIRVRDAGIGIEPKMLSHIFEMFVQARDHGEHAQGGLGIGLSLVRTIVEMHGGSIAASSEGPGTGSEFVVLLPTIRPPRVAPPSGPAPARASGEAPPRRRVLVVDDNVDAARSLARLLSRLYGQDVRVAHDGPEALAVAAEFLPDVALLDIGLPGMDGHELAGRLRARPESGALLLVALTGWGQEADRQRSREAGFDHHLVKPVEPEAIRDLLAGIAPPAS